MEGLRKRNERGSLVLIIHQIRARANILRVRALGDELQVELVARGFHTVRVRVLLISTLKDAVLGARLHVGADRRVPTVPRIAVRCIAVLMEPAPCNAPYKILRERAFECATPWHAHASHMRKAGYKQFESMVTSLLWDVHDAPLEVRTHSLNSSVGCLSVFNVPICRWQTGKVRSGMMMMARVSGGRKRTRTESARARVRTGSAAHLLGRGRGDGDGSDRLVKHRIPRTIAAIGTGRRRSGRTAARTAIPTKLTASKNQKHFASFLPNRTPIQDSETPSFGPPV